MIKLLPILLEQIKDENPSPSSQQTPPQPPTPPENTNTPIDPDPEQIEKPEEIQPQIQTITRDEAKQMIKNTKGKFFTVTFIKKDGTTRVMNARLGVKAYLKGGELPYNPEEKGLIPVYSMDTRAYRMINANTITDLKIGNNTYKVT